MFAGSEELGRSESDASIPRCTPLLPSSLAEGHASLLHQPCDIPAHLDFGTTHHSPREMDQHRYPSSVPFPPPRFQERRVLDPRLVGFIQVFRGRAEEILWALRRALAFARTGRGGDVARLLSHFPRTFPQPGGPIREGIDQKGRSKRGSCTLTEVIGPPNDTGLYDESFSHNLQIPTPIPRDLSPGPPI